MILLTVKKKLKKRSQIWIRLDFNKIRIRSNVWWMVNAEFIDNEGHSDESLPSKRITVTKNLFLPSGNSMWEIQSRTNKTSYYVDLALTFCSCKGFYYNYNRKKCYHISEVHNCIENSNYLISIYEDKNYYQVIKSIILHIISSS